VPRGGLFWGRFWLAFSSFFYVFFVLFCFLLFLRCAAPWKATRKPKRLPRAPPEAPEAPQGLLNSTPSVPKSTRRGFQKAPDRLTRALEYPKKIREAFSRTLKFPRWPQDAPTSTSGGTQESPRAPQESPRGPQEKTKGCAGHPKSTPSQTKQNKKGQRDARNDENKVLSRVAVCPA
jgi:hypothetical protein